MVDSVDSGDGRAILGFDQFDALLALLRDDGYQCIGPSVRDGAIVHHPIASAAELPIGWGESQEAGRYRLQRRGDGAAFGFNVGPQSWKQFLFVPRLQLFRSQRRGDDIQLIANDEAPPRLAFIGVRACDLHAIAVQDRVFRDGATQDPDYAARRANAFIVAVNCGQAGGTCFCTSMGTGPRATSGFDLALTELLEPEHRFVVTAGSDRGHAVLARLPTAIASQDDLAAEATLIAATSAAMPRHLDTNNIKELLYANQEHPHWDEVATRCLSCTNCTMVCPTCFCSTVDDVTDLSGDTAERSRRWDSCFNGEHSYLHGGSVRGTTKARYRQWLTHKLASWIDQFDTSGCVGCGRCITWCPPGIDLTAEVEALRTVPPATSARATRAPLPRASDGRQE